MPKSKNISSYPDEYFQLFRKAIADGQYQTPPAKLKEIQALAFDLQGFRGALRHEGHPESRVFDQVQVCTRKLPEGLAFLLIQQNSLVGLLGDLSEAPATPTAEPVERVDTFDLTEESEPELDMDQSINDFLNNLGSKKND